jgi:integrase/recombinase XerC
VYLSPTLQRILADYRKTLKQKGAGDWVFSPKRSLDSRLSEISKPLRAAFKSAGLYSKGNLLHVLRYSCASHLLGQGTPLHTVKEILGHASITTTEIYLRSSEDAKRKAAGNALV